MAHSSFLSRYRASKERTPLKDKIRFYFRITCCAVFVLAYAIYYAVYLQPALANGLVRACLKTSKYAPIDLSAASVFPRRLAEAKCPAPYDPPVLVLPYSIGVVGALVSLGIVIDGYFVPAIDVLTEEWDLTPDVAGATLMSVGSSAPELFVSAIGTFLRSDVGIGAIIGSAIFNTVAVIGALPFFVSKPMNLLWYPVTRDCCMYTVILSLLSVFLGYNTPGIIEWWEALLLQVFYWGYILLMVFNTQVADYFHAYDNLKPPGPEVTIETSRRERTNSSKSKRDRANSLSFYTTKRSINDMVRVSILSDFTRTAEEAFSKYDLDNSGVIDSKELEALLKDLGIEPSEVNIKAIYLELDTDQNGLIDRTEFCVWYLKSQERLDADLRRCFDAIDKDHSGVISSLELRGMVAAVAGILSDADMRRVFKELSVVYVDAEGKEVATNSMEQSDLENLAITLEDGGQSSTKEITFEAFANWYKGCVYKHVQDRRAEKMGADASYAQLYPPSGADLGFFTLFWYLFTIVPVFVFWLCVPDVRVPGRRNYRYSSFFLSISFVGVISYFMVDWIERIGATLYIPSVIMGLTILAAGASVPDFLSALVVAVHGQYDQALASAIGSNIYDIAVCLGIPWLLFMAVYQESITIFASLLAISVPVLILCIVLMLVALKLNNWILDKKVGWFYCLMYFGYMGLQLGLAEWGTC